MFELLLVLCHDGKSADESAASSSLITKPFIYFLMPPRDKVRVLEERCIVKTYLRVELDY